MAEPETLSYRLATAADHALVVQLLAELVEFLVQLRYQLLANVISHTLLRSAKFIGKLFD